LDGARKTLQMAIETTKELLRLMNTNPVNAHMAHVEPSVQLIRLQTIAGFMYSK